MRSRWVCTVLMLMNNSAAISALLRPTHTPRNTSTSRADRPVSSRTRVRSASCAATVSMACPSSAPRTTTKLPIDTRSPGSSANRLTRLGRRSHTSRCGSSRPRGASRRRGAAAWRGPATPWDRPAERRRTPGRVRSERSPHRCRSSDGSRRRGRQGEPYEPPRVLQRCAKSTSGGTGCSTGRLRQGVRTTRRSTGRPTPRAARRPTTTPRRPSRRAPGPPARPSCRSAWRSGCRSSGRR